MQEGLFATAKALLSSHVLSKHPNFLSLEQRSLNGTDKPPLLQFIAWYININLCPRRVTASPIKQYLPRAAASGTGV